MTAFKKSWSLGYVDIDKMRSITNIKCVAEQLKSARIKSNAADEAHNSKKTVVDGVDIGQENHKSIVQNGTI